MKYCLALGLMVLCVSARGQNAPVVFSVGVEDYPNFLPYSEYHNGEYRGLGRAIMDAFAEQMGYRFEYRALPLKRRDAMFVQGKLDFAFPDNPNWVAELKRNVRVRYAPLLEFTDGVLVKRKDMGKGVAHLKVLGIPLGFTPYPYQQLMSTGAIRVEESGGYDGLYDKLIAGRVDGAYMNAQIADYYWTRIRPNQEIPIVYDPDLPHASGHWYLSSINRPQVVEELNNFIKKNQSLINDLKKQYGFSSPAE
ncbi:MULTISPECIES: ABC transporter substrate-binding protein [unclassified Duganella]|uniref:substrate-binding periplasmic protein n=1 Tax=unclassified Duganella TaxID=2636909 RepID=UPI000893361F|nr:MULTISPECIES: transporter substrate-binding domain-containing protein [unclassified Duganella]OEZ63896.1 bacterial extracellular solute-binding protein, family 3 [Duganella sp. HH105]OFA06951.1 bacterial extracellular solute-binding protein, family 3 [Duganella sp. HH101]